jgi:hypothetical protein
LAGAGLVNAGFPGVEEGADGGLGVRGEVSLREGVGESMELEPEKAAGEGVHGG